MSPKEFDAEKAKKFLEERELAENEQREAERKRILEHTVGVLKEEFSGTGVEVFLVGSIIRPYSFSSRSDIDIVLKNFHGDRFDIWPKLDRKLEREVEVILFEKSNFQEFILKEGLKVV